MAFSAPKNIPSFSNPNRASEDRLWGASGVTSRHTRTPDTGAATGLMQGVQDQVGNFFLNGSRSRGSGGGGGGLPMYKDKPYSYASSRRSARNIRTCQGIAGIVIILCLTVLYLLGTVGKKHGAQLGAKQWGWLNSPAEGRGGKVDWTSRRERVVEAFELSWDAYERNAWGYDEYHPIAKTGKYMSPKGLGWIIVDSLDTMMIMNLTSRVEHAREWISKTLTWNQDQDVNTFETTIRMLGGLLSAHYLSTEFPDLAPVSGEDDDLYLEKARDLADRLMAAFDSPSGIPFASVHLSKMRGIPSHADNGASSTAEAATLQLEFKYMAKLTGERDFWDKAERVMQLVDDNGAKDGLVPIFIYPSTGEFKSRNIRLGSRGDSYYEYLIKQYLQTNKEEPVYEDMWNEALAGVRKHLVTYTTPSGFTIIGERPDGLEGALSPKMDHLVCFMPGTIALAATGGLTEAEARAKPGFWTSQKDDDMQLARELMHTCWATYKFMATGLAPEITHFRLPDPPPPYAAPHPDPPVNLDNVDGSTADWRMDFIVKPADVHNLQRPETVESLLYMWRITGEEKYRDWGWDMFKAFANYTAVEDGGGFTSLSNANVIPPLMRDNMESFWLAETLKYMYLLFSPADLLPLDKIVFNTEAHPLPKFSLASPSGTSLFSTGWKRKPRDASGAIVLVKDDAAAAAADDKGAKTTPTTTVAD